MDPNDGWSIVSLGDGALLVELADQPSAATTHRLQAMAAAVERAALPAVVEVQAGLGSLAVVVDPGHPAADDVATALPALLGSTAATASIGTAHVVDVCFDDDLGPDLTDLAAAAGCDVATWIAAFTAVELDVLGVGFLPGFAYLGPLPPALHAPRLATPRVRVPAGSVAIADGMAAVYPSDSPGGWRIVGATPDPVFDVAADPPTRFRPGDRVRFRPIARSELDARRRDRS